MCEELYPPSIKRMRGVLLWRLGTRRAEWERRLACIESAALRYTHTPPPCETSHTTYTAYSYRYRYTHCPPCEMTHTAHSAYLTGRAVCLCAVRAVGSHGSAGECTEHLPPCYDTHGVRMTYLTGREGGLCVRRFERLDAVRALPAWRAFGPAAH